MLRFVQSAVRMSTRVVGQHSRVTSAAALTTTATRNFSLKHRDGWLEIEEISLFQLYAVLKTRML
eukprot:m.87440 g.87440  ORF g.87440 m.87440 type:complete len:65 (-) comp12241_c1_seq2:813-1007(-)